MRFLALVLLTASVLHVSAQAPQAFSFQAVATTAGGAAIADASIGVRISLRSGATDGPVVYRETHTTTTSPRGLFTLAIGRGNVVSGTFASIAWGANRHFVELEIDPAGGTSYTTLGVQELLSVPYALYAGNLSTDAATGAIVGVVDIPFDLQNTDLLAELYLNGDQIATSGISPNGKFSFNNRPTGNYIVVISDNSSRYFDKKIHVAHLVPGITTLTQGFNEDRIYLTNKPLLIITSFSASIQGSDIVLQVTRNNQPNDYVVFIISEDPNPSTENSILVYSTFLPSAEEVIIPVSSSPLISSRNYYVRAYPSSRFGQDDILIDPFTGEIIIDGLNPNGASEVRSITIP